MIKFMLTPLGLAILIMLGYLLYVGVARADTKSTQWNGIGYEESGDEAKIDNYILVSNLRFDLGPFHLRQGHTDMYGMSLGGGVEAVRYHIYRIHALAHVNPGINCLDEMQGDSFPCGANMYYDVGLKPAIECWDHLILSIYTGYRRGHNTYYITDGDINVRGFFTRLGIALEF